MDLSCAIIGGGLLGQTMALRLAQRGARVTLFEAADHLGGLADAWQLGEARRSDGATSAAANAGDELGQEARLPSAATAKAYTWDRHYHVTLLSDRRLQRLLSEVGLEDELTWGQTKTGFYAGGSLHSMSSSWEFLRFPPLGLVDKLRLGWTIWHASRIRDGHTLDGVSVEDWLRKHSGTRVFETMWRPLLESKLGETYHETSASFIWATINRMYAARRSGLKREMFGYVRGGYARILQRLQETLVEQGVDIRVGSPVRRIAGTTQQRLTVETEGRQESFDRAVVTLPPVTARHVCPDLAPEEAASWESARMLGVLCVSLLLRKPLAGYYVTNITDDGFPFTGVIEMTALVDRSHFDGHTLVYLPRYLPSDDAQFDVTDESIQGQFFRGLQRMYPQLTEQDLVACRTSRARHVMAIPQIGYAQRVPSVETSIDNLLLVSSAQILNNTLNVDATIAWAESQVDRVLAGTATSNALRTESYHEQTSGELVARS